MKQQTNVLLKPEIKAALKNLAADDNCSEGRLIEELIKAEVKRRKRRKSI